MNIYDLAIGQAKEISNLFGQKQTNKGLQSLVGETVIIRTYSAGVHFGKLVEKDGNEVILEKARRLYYWKTNGGISLSEVATTGLHEDSKVCVPLDKLWLEAIEIISCTEKAIKSIYGMEDHVV